MSQTSNLPTKPKTFAAAPVGQGLGGITENTTLTLGTDDDIHLFSVPLTVTGLDQTSGGAVYGPGNLIVTGAATICGTGMLQTGAGVTYVEGTTTLTGGELDLDGGRVFENSGTLTAGSATGTTTINLGVNASGTATGAATLINDAGGHFKVDDELTIGVGAADLTAGATPDAFNNRGAVEIAGTGNTVTISANLVNTGSLTIDAGDTLLLDQTNAAFTQRLGGLIQGAGTLEIEGNAVLSATNLNVAALTLLQGATALGADINYTGTFLATASGAGAPALKLGGHRFTTTSFSNSDLTLTGAGRFTATGSNDTVTLGANEIDVFTGNDDNLTAAGGDVVSISAGSGDAIQGRNFTLHAARSATFAVGGGGASAAVDSVTGSNDTMTILGASHVAISGMNNQITSAGGSRIALSGSFNTVSAGAGDVLSVAHDVGDSISGAGFSLSVGSGARIEIGGNTATGNLDQATGSLASFHVSSASHVAISGSGDTIASDGNSQISVLGNANAISAGDDDVINIAGANGDTISGENVTVSASSGAVFAIDDRQAGGAFTIAATGATIGVDAQAALTLTGADDSLNLKNGGGTVTALSVNGLYVWNAVDGSFDIGTSKNDTILGSGNEVYGGAAARFTIGGNGATGDADIVAISQSTVTVAANSSVVIETDGSNQASNDAIISQGGSSISLDGASCTLTAGAADQISIAGASNVVLAAADDYIDDAGSGSLLKFSGGGAGPNYGVVTVAGLFSDTSGVIDLLSGAGGFASASAAYGAVVDDASGCHLSLGTQGVINFVGVDKAELSAGNFKIG